MLPVGDKVVLKKVEIAEKEGAIVLPEGGDAILCEVVAVGKGIPYGRGEFYEPVLKKGDWVFVPRAAWSTAAQIRLKLGEARPSPYKVLHEREILMAVEQSEL
jgi:co-chaperonin GroES (HSP10)